MAMKVTITGDNAAQRDQAWQKLLAAFEAEHGDLAIERLDGEEAEFAQLQEALQSLPFLSARKLVLIRGGSQNKTFVEAIETLLQELPTSTDLILLEPKLDKRSVYYKTLKQATDFKDFAELDERGLARWLVESAKAAGGQLGQTDALWLVERVGADQQLLANELEKLLLYDPAISRQTIELLTEAAPQSTIFELIEAAFAGRPGRALQLYDEQRAQKVEPPQIIAMLGWQLHVLALLATAGDRSADAVAGQAKISPYVVKRTASLARRLSRQRITRLTADLSDLDYRLKRLPLNPDEALKNYLLKLGQTKTPAA